MVAIAASLDVCVLVLSFKLGRQRDGVKRESELYQVMVCDFIPPTRQLTTVSSSAVSSLSLSESPARSHVVKSQH